MTLPTRLLDLANRCERALTNMDPSEVRELIRQDVADLREAARLLQARGPGRWKRLWRRIAGRPIDREEWEDLQW